MRVVVIGLGYSGIATALSLCEIGHTVVGIDINPNKVVSLNMGKSPVYEPDTDHLIYKYVNENKLMFRDNYSLVSTCQAVMFCVNAGLNNEFGLEYNELATAVKSVIPHTKSNIPLIIRTTVEPGTCQNLYEFLEREAPFTDISLIYFPDFSKHGTAMRDNLFPDRIVIGCSNRKHAEVVCELYANNCKTFVITSWVNAEIIKLSSDVFLATKISYINLLSRLSDALGGDIEDISLGLGLDSRINPGALQAGMGWGGSELPKDVMVFNRMLTEIGIDNHIINGVIGINDNQVTYLANKIEKALKGLKGKEIAILGLTYKPDTDDISDSKSMELARYLMLRGAVIKVYDPIRNDKIPNFKADHYVDIEKTIAYSQAVIVATPWKDFSNLNWVDIKNWMGGSLIVDAQNTLNRQDIEGVGLRYLGIGK